MGGVLEDREAMSGLVDIFPGLELRPIEPNSADMLSGLPNWGGPPNSGAEVCGDVEDMIIGAPAMGMGEGGVSIGDGESELSGARLPPSLRWIQIWAEAFSRIDPPWSSITKLTLA